MINCSQEKIKTTQHNEIASLKRRVKKLEKKNRSRTHKLKRLCKVGLTVRVESSDNEESLGEDASKQGRIDAIDADEEITLEVFVPEQEVVVKDVNNVVSTAGDATTVSAATTTIAITTNATITTVDDITLAQALMEIKSTKPKEKRVVIQELAIRIKIKSSIMKNSIKLQAEFDKEERLLRERAEKDKEANIALIEIWDDIQAMIDLKDGREKKQTIQQSSTRKDIVMFDRAFKRVNTFEDFRIELVEGKEKRAGTELIQENEKKQKVKDDKETAELKQCLEIIPDEEEVTIDAIPLAVKSPSIVG
ncbi:hypothetical protein Tco_0073552 [Tanacetum coccineum]